MLGERDKERSRAPKSSKGVEPFSKVSDYIVFEVLGIVSPLLVLYFHDDRNNCNIKNVIKKKITKKNS